MCLQLVVVESRLGGVSEDSADGANRAMAVSLTTQLTGRGWSNLLAKVIVEVDEAT